VLYHFPFLCSHFRHNLANQSPLEYHHHKHLNNYKKIIVGEVHDIGVGRTDFGVRGEDLISVLLKELKPFLGESSSMISNFSLAIVIKQSSAANIVAPSKQLK